MVYVQFMLSELRPFFNLKNNQLLISLINIAKDNIFLNIYICFICRVCEFITKLNHTEML